MSFSEKLALAKKRKQDTLKRIDDLIEETETSHLFDKSHLLNRNCCAYDVINDLISFSRTMDGKLRVGFASDVLGIWKAMLIAYGLRDESIIIRSDTPELPLEDEEWILKLSEMFKEHWDEKHSVYVDFYKKRGLRIRNPEQNPKIVAK